MKGKNLFLKWSLFAILVIIGAVVAAGLGMDGYLQRDPTHISYLTLLVFGLATLRCGKLAWRLSGTHEPQLVKAGLARVTNAAHNCMYIGMIGTAIGMLLMLENAKVVQDPSQVIGIAVANAYIAFVNTVFGAICGVLVKLQADEIHVAFDLLHPEKGGGAS